MEISVESLREEYLNRNAPLSPTNTMNSSMRYKSTRYPKNLDRFIPNRSAMDFDYAHYMLTEGRTKGKENLTPGLCPPSREAYQKLLAATFNMNRTRILAFKDKPPTSVTCISDFPHLCPSRIVKPLRHIPHKPKRILDASGLIDDFHLNLLDWGSHGTLAIALTNSVVYWDPKDDSTSEDSISEVVFADEYGPITSISWSPDGQHIAIGLSNSRVEIWDYISNKKLRTLKCGRNSHVGSLVWNNDILTTGRTNGKVFNNDLRMRSPTVQIYKGHRQEVCGLKWSAEGQYLASGGKDNLVHIWDKAKASSNSPTQWLHRHQDHTAAVRALSWCPYQRNLLASGGGEGDHSIKFWNTKSGSCLNSIDTGSEVCALLWNKNEHELLSSHGLSQNQLALWRYPSMVKMAELTGHTSRVLFMAQNPKDGTVASAAGAGDERLMTWNIFPTLENVKPIPKVDFEPFAAVNRIR